MLTLFTLSPAEAQDKFKIRPLQKTSIRRFQYDIYAYASGGINDAMSLSVLNNQYNMNMYSKSTHANIGINGCLNYKRYLAANVGIGYTHERIAYDKGLFGDNGIYASWINADVSLSLLCFSLGMDFDFFLGSRVNNKDNFSYEGLNEHCFNTFSCYTYVSVSSIFRNFKIEVRAGTYLKPHLNPDKIAYYNSINTYVESLYFEFRLSYRLFTSGNRIAAPERFLVIKGQSI